jgi:hypothetical protein
VSSLDVSRLGPKDAAAALRSYPRRYRALLQPGPDDDQAEELAHRVGPDGESSMQLLSDTTRTLVILAEALHQITINPTPVVHPAVIDPAQRQWEALPPERLDDALTLFTDEATGMAEAIDGVATDSWTRTGTVAGGDTVSALDVAREATRVGHDGLNAIERTLRAVRA